VFSLERAALNLLQ